MPRYYFFLFSFFLYSGLAQCQTTYITHVNVVPVANGPQILYNQTLIIEGERIKEIRAYKKGDEKVKVLQIDGSGKYLIPGLADMHVHLPAKGEMSLDRFFRLNLAAGVTTLRSMRGEPEHLALRDSIRKKKLLAPDLYISVVLPGDSTTTAADLRKFVSKAAGEGWDFIKYLGGLSPALFDSAAKACVQNHIRLAGHACNNDIQTAIRASQASVEHYQSLLKAFRSDSIHFDKVLDDLKEKNIYVCPTLSFYYIWGMQFSKEQLLSRNGMDKIDTSLRNTWMRGYMSYLKKFDVPGKEGEREKAHQLSAKNLHAFGRLLKQMQANGVQLLLSPDHSEFNVPGYALVEEMLLYQQAGLSNYEILKIATWQAARFFMAETDWGGVEVHSKANLVLLDKNPLDDIAAVKTVYGTFMGGKFYRPADLIGR
jgi:hypothetical protein